MRPFIAASLALAIALAPLALPRALAADEPDAVYAKYHRAAASGDLDSMVQYTQAAQRAEILSMSPAQKNAMVKMLAATMPRGHSLRNKSVARDGKTARLVVSGAADVRPGLDPETLYGLIRMTMEGGEWKVSETEWTNTAPAGLPPIAGRPGTAAAAPGAAPVSPASKSAPPARGGGLVGSTSTPPERKLGQAKEPCVYKAVMTAEDLENCR